MRDRIRVVSRNHSFDSQRADGLVPGVEPPEDSISQVSSKDHGRTASDDPVQVLLPVVVIHN